MRIRDVRIGFMLARRNACGPNVFEAVFPYSEGAVSPRKAVRPLGDTDWLVDFMFYGDRLGAPDLTRAALCSDVLSAIAVGMPVTGHPPHRSVRAQLGHTAPTLSSDGEPVFPRETLAFGSARIGASDLHTSGMFNQPSAVIPARHFLLQPSQEMALTRSAIDNNLND